MPPKKTLGEPDAGNPQVRFDEGALETGLRSGLNGHEAGNGGHSQEEASKSAFCRKATGGQGVHREVESEGFEEKYRAVIDGGYPEDEPVGQRWGKVESALWRRRRSHPPTVPRCLRAARYGRLVCDPRRTYMVSGWLRNKGPYKRKRNGKRCQVSSRTTE